MLKRSGKGFYPVNSAVFIKDAKSKFRGILNDRPMAASAGFYSDRIEYINEPLHEKTRDGKPQNFTGSFKLVFSDSYD